MYTASIILLGILPPALLFLFSQARKDSGDLHPLRVMAWALLIGYTLKSLYIAYAINYDAPFKVRYLSEGIVPYGQLAICVGIAAFLFGFLFTYRGKSHIAIDPPPARRTSGYPELLYYPVFAISLLLMIIYFYQMGFLEQVLTLRFQATKWFIDEEGVASSLGFLTIGGDILLVFFLYYIAFSPKINWLSMYSLAIMFCGLCYMLASKRTGVLLIIVSFLMVVGLRRLRGLQMPRLGGLVFAGVALILLAFVGAIREGGGAKEVGDLNMSDSVAVTSEHLFEGAYFLDPAKTAVILDQTKRRNLYLNGESFIAPVFAPVPRILWPEKPVIRIGPFVAQEVLRYKSHSGAPPGGIGELYLNFGWPGILIGMTILGVGTALLYQRYLATYDKRFSRPLYVLMLIAIMLFLISDFVFSSLYVIRYGVAALICLWFWRKRIALTEGNGDAAQPHLSQVHRLSAT